MLLLLVIPFALLILREHNHMLCGNMLLQSGALISTVLTVVVLAWVISYSVEAMRRGALPNEIHHCRLLAWCTQSKFPSPAQTEHGSTGAERDH